MEAISPLLHVIAQAVLKRAASRISFLALSWGNGC